MKISQLIFVLAIAVSGHARKAYEFGHNITHVNSPTTTSLGPPKTNTTTSGGAYTTNSTKPMNTTSTITKPTTTTSTVTKPTNTTANVNYSNSTKPTNATTYTNSTKPTNATTYTNSTGNKNSTNSGSSTVAIPTKPTKAEKKSAIDAINEATDAFYEEGLKLKYYLADQEEEAWNLLDDLDYELRLQNKEIKALTRDWQDALE